MRRSEATRHPPNRHNQFKLAIRCDRLRVSRVWRPQVTRLNDSQRPGPRRRRRRQPRTDHVGLQNLEGGFRIRNDRFVHSPHKHRICRCFGITSAFAHTYL